MNLKAVRGYLFDQLRRMIQTVNNAKENYDLSAMNLDTFLGGLRSPTG